MTKRIEISQIQAAEERFVKAFGHTPSMRELIAYMKTGEGPALRKGEPRQRLADEDDDDRGTGSARGNAGNHPPDEDKARARLHDEQQRYDEATGMNDQWIPDEGNDGEGYHKTARAIRAAQRRPQDEVWRSVAPVEAHVHNKLDSPTARAIQKIHKGEVALGPMEKLRQLGAVFKGDPPPTTTRLAVRCTDGIVREIEITGRTTLQKGSIGAVQRALDPSHRREYDPSTFFKGTTPPPQDEDITDDGGRASTGATNDWRDQSAPTTKPTAATAPHSASMRQVPALPTQDGSDGSLEAIKQDLRKPKQLIPGSLRGDRDQDPNRDDNF